MSQFEQFGKYILLEKLASGGMAEVYLAKSVGANGVNKFLAIKRILPQFSDNVEFINMFKEEAKIAVNLNHGNVVSIYDFGIEDKQFYLVMEYVEGKNLRQMLNELKKANLELSIDQIIYLIKEVAAGLDHAHRCIDGATGKPLNITHRDMSPQNIMLSYEGEIKVIDFGIAKAETQAEATKAGTLKGKFGYMSPEQAEGYAIDSRTDVFSLGIILWELLANERLFAGGNEAAILRKIRECQIPPISKFNPSVPRELESIVLKALAKDKSLRYQKASDLNRDLNRYLNTYYPDFSPGDLSLFVKQAFSEHYSDQKRKLVEFAKIQFQPQEPVKKSIQNDPTRIEQIQVSEENEVPAAFANINLNNAPNMDGASILRQPPGISNTSILMKSQTRSAISSNSTKLNQMPHNLTHTGIKAQRPQNNNSSNFILQSLIFVCLGLAGWLGYKEFYLNKKPIEKSELSSQAALPPVKPLAIENAASSNHPPKPIASELVEVMIDSNPSVARIIINGEEKNIFTPRTLSLTPDKEYTIKLVKEGYITYETFWTPVKSGDTLKGTLQPYRNTAYISISIMSGGGANPIIEVNGEKLTEKPPIAKYTIPADVPVTIKATNPFTGATAEKTIKVNPYLKENVELMLGFEKRGQ